MAENSSLSSSKVWGETPQEIFSPTYGTLPDQTVMSLSFVLGPALLAYRSLHCLPESPVSHV